MNSRSHRLSLSPSLRRIFIEAFILCVLSVAVGLSLNFKLIFNAFSGKAVTSTAFSPTGPTAPADGDAGEQMAFPIPVALDELDELLAAGALLVDARSFDLYQQEHMSGAVSLPFADLAEHFEEFKQQVSFETTLVTYCSGYGCPDSFELGVSLLQAGYSDVLVYEGGLPEWRDAGRPLQGAAQ